MYDTYKSLAFFLDFHLFSEEEEFTNCLGNLDKQLPGQLPLTNTRFLPEKCQISKSEGKKCQEWLIENRNMIEKTLDQCLQQL